MYGRGRSGKERPVRCKFFEAKKELAQWKYKDGEASVFSDPGGERRLPAILSHQSRLQELLFASRNEGFILVPLRWNRLPLYGPPVQLGAVSDVDQEYSSRILEVPEKQVWVLGYTLPGIFPGGALPLRTCIDAYGCYIIPSCPDTPFTAFWNRAKHLEGLLGCGT